jgi:hypothetical protein
MAERVLTERKLNRAVLARQLLLERARLPIPRALERLAGIQNQYAPNAYVRLWSCLENFRRDDLDRALARRSVVQGTLMRVTIHLVSARDYWPLAMGLRQARRDWWLKQQQGRVTNRDMEAHAAKLRAALAEGPRGKEIDDLLRGQVSLWLDVVRAPPSGTWARRRADLYAAAEDWLGACDSGEQEGLERLVRRYLGGFGPATPNAVAAWSGVPATVLEPVLARLDLRRYRDEQGRELVDVPRAPLPDGETPVPVRFLPTWDAALLVHARASGILPERYRPRIFNTKNPFSHATFLVDGAVAGTWRYEQGRIRLDPFERIARTVRKELNEEGERLAAFHAAG